METNVDEIISELYEQDSVTSLNGDAGFEPEELISEVAVSDNALPPNNQVTNYLLGCNLCIMLLILGLGVCAFFYKVVFDGIFKIL